MDEYRIIKDARVLTEHFIPRLIVHRDGQLQAVRDALKPILRGQKSRNVFLWGDTGTGKTCLSRYVAEELSSYSSSVMGSYVNCWLYPSRFKILYNILHDLGQVFSVHRKGTPTDELLDIFRKKTQDRQCIIILDEVDQIEDDKILYDLLRLENLGLILISNRENALYKVDSRIRSSLASAERVVFRRYSPSEVFDILKHRAEWGLYPHAVSDSQLRKIASLSGGDARVGIDILRVVSERAESNDDEKIRDEYINSAISVIRESSIKQETERLNDHQKIVYSIISNSGAVNAGELYPLYRKECKRKGVAPVVDRTLRKYLEKLIRYGIVTAKSEGRWRVYRTGKSPN